MERSTAVFRFKPSKEARIIAFENSQIVYEVCPKNCWNAIDPAK
jgi:hypothetical protein